MGSIKRKKFSLFRKSYMINKISIKVIVNAFNFVNSPLLILIIFSIFDNISWVFTHENSKTQLYFSKILGLSKEIRTFIKLNLK